MQAHYIIPPSVAVAENMKGLCIADSHMMYMYMSTSIGGVGVGGGGGGEGLRDGGDEGMGWR